MLIEGHNNFYGRVPGIEAIRKIAWVLVATVSCLGSVNAQSSNDVGQQPDPGPYEKFEFNTESLLDGLVSPDDIAKQYRDREYVAEVLNFRQARQHPQVRSDMIDDMAEETFRQVASELAVGELLYHTAELQGFVENEAMVQRRLNDARDMVASFIYYQQHILEKVEEPGEEELQALYDEVREERFQRPESYRVRMIEVQKTGGDSRERIESARQRLQAGDDFITVAQQYSDQPEKGVVQGPVNVENLDSLSVNINETALGMIEQTEAGELSEIVEHENSYQLFKVEEVLPAQDVSFEEARPVLVQRLKQLQLQELSMVSAMKTLQAYKDRFQIHYDLLESETPQPHAVVMEGDGMRVAMRELSAIDQDYMTNIKTSEELDRALVKLQRVDMMLRKIAAREAGVYESEAFKNGLAQVRIDIVAGAFLGNYAEGLLVMNEERLRDFYQHYRSYFYEPRKLDLYAIQKRLEDGWRDLQASALQQRIAEVIDNLENATKDIDTLEAFKALAMEISDDPQTQSRGGAMGMITEIYRDGYKGTLQTLKPGNISQPVHLDGIVYVFYAAGEEPAGTRSFEEVRTAIENQYKLMGAQQVYDRMIDEYVESQW